MKRRDFLQSAGAAATLPLLPMKAAAGVALAPDLVARATSWVGLWDFSAPHLLKYRFNLDDDVAEALFNRLVRDAAISAPNRAGIAKVVAPRMARPFPARGLDTLIKQKFAVSAASTKAATTQQTTQAVDDKAPETQKASRDLREDLFEDEKFDDDSAETDDTIEPEIETASDDDAEEGQET